jgi:hypothetical protein
VKEFELKREVEAESETPLQPGDAQVVARHILRDRGEHQVPMFCETLFAYTSMNIDDALTSKDAVIRSLAILDRRVGKRRLSVMADATPTTEMECRCLNLRLDAEKISRN